MPSHKSCKKRVKTSEKERVRNRAVRSQLRSVLKDVQTASVKEEAVQKLKEATILLDKAASRGLIHKKNADRNKSRLTRKVNKLS
ncbi:MAG: 30S ribosomal protein S20 [candidate division Zixibacteria bacterium]|nr:30S ribosomal protein S20 [candidate division Zixibacteria bacterium]